MDAATHCGCTCRCGSASRRPRLASSVSSGSASVAAGTARFFGSGTLNLGPSGTMPAVIQVDVTEGGAGVGTMTLSVLNLLFFLPTETVMHGRITIR
jgi:hypothetical protein